MRKYCEVSFFQLKYAFSINLPWQEQIAKAKERRPLRAHWTKFSSGILRFFYFYLLFDSMPLKYDATFVRSRERWTSSRKSFKTNNILEVLPFSVLLFSSQQLHRERELFIRSHARAPQRRPFLLLSTEAKSWRPIRWREASLFCQKVHKPNWRIAFENSFFFSSCCPEKFSPLTQLVQFPLSNSNIIYLLSNRATQSPRRAPPCFLKSLTIYWCFGVVVVFFSILYSVGKSEIFLSLVKKYKIRFRSFGSLVRACILWSEVVKRKNLHELSKRSSFIIFTFIIEKYMSYLTSRRIAIFGVLGIQQFRPNKCAAMTCIAAELLHFSFNALASHLTLFHPFSAPLFHKFLSSIFAWFQEES